jgi:hypothetical protein
MISLHLKVDPVYVVYYTLTRCAPESFIAGQPFEQIVAFQNRAWAFDRESYDVFRHGVTDKFILRKGSLEQLIERANKFLHVMTEEPLFRPILDETLGALSRVEEEWECNFAKSHGVMQEITGLNLTKEFEVYITHPSLKTGMNMDGVILWTHRQDFPNYNTVYLWHEIMHSFIDSTERTKDEGELEHAVIELLTDHELRVRLNGGNYPPFIGHKQLHRLEKRLLPSWRTYLKSSDKNIMQFIKVANAKLLPGKTTPARIPAD